MLTRRDEDSAPFTALDVLKYGLPEHWVHE